MATYKGQCPKLKSPYRGKFRWIKRQMNRLMRRMAKRNPEDAWRRKYFWGYYL
jgi:hypothetical protein